ncbi:MAG TPA: NADH dehydrogenase (quinone) subunit D [Polyangiaceae bacterium]|jgi:NADH-quinone oxidoreductase subunit D|nr:NADH dehydrogenase (quinone) subunit D [Polyangiaceae bacterium]
MSTVSSATGTSSTGTAAHEPGVQVNPPDAGPNEDIPRQLVSHELVWDESEQRDLSRRAGFGTNTERALVESAYRAQQELEHGFDSEQMMLNIGPSHPSTHGVLRLVVKLDGEVIRDIQPDIGYLHRGDEKIAENMTYAQFVPYTDRLDYLAPLANNVAYAYAVEKLLGITVPKRCQYIRVICTELARISSHLLGIGCFGMDVGAMTIFLYTFQEREKIYDLCECISGARFTTSYTRIGGLLNDMPPEFEGMLRTFLRDFPKNLKEVDQLLTKNRIFCDRTREIGVLDAQDALDLGVTGPILRASGVDWDLRKARPYSSYEDFDFDVPTGSVGDCYDRYLVRMEEMRQSMRIIEQALAKMPEGPVDVDDPKIVLPKKRKVLTKMEELIHQFVHVTTGVNAPAGEVYFSAENPKGELGFHIVSKGGGVPHRLKIRSPSFANLQAVPAMSNGHMITDLVAILASIDFVMGECDR